MEQKRSVLGHVLAYVLWIISTCVLALTLNKLREAILLAVVVGTNSSQLSDKEQFYASYRVAAATHWSILIIGLIVLILMIALEHYYRNGMTEGVLWKRFFLITGIEFLVLFASHTGYNALEQSLLSTGWTTVALLVIEAVLAVICFWLSRRSRKQPNLLRMI